MIGRATLMVSAQRALLFGVTKAARFISIEERDGGLQMRVYLDSEPTPDECDVYYAASGEITGDFVLAFEVDQEQARLALECVTVDAGEQETGVPPKPVVMKRCSSTSTGSAYVAICSAPVTTIRAQGRF